MQAIVHFYAEPVRNGPSRLSQSVALSAYFEQLNDPIFLWDQWTQVASLVSRAFAFVFSWYKLIIDLSLYFSSWGLQHTVHISIIAAKIVSPEFFFELQYFGPDLRLARTKKLYQSGQYKMQTADRVQNADCRLGAKCRLRIYTVFSSDTWYHVILQLSERHAIAFPRLSFTIICIIVEYS